MISRDVDVGQTVAASLQAPTPFTIANDLTRMQVDADVDESFIGDVREGNRFDSRCLRIPNREFGRVAQSAAAAQSRIRRGEITTASSMSTIPTSRSNPA